MSAIESSPFGAPPGDITPSDESATTPLVAAKTSQSPTATPDSGSPPSNVNYSPDSTLFIFDWDDTLLPSSWLGQQELTIDEKCVVPETAKESLKRMAELCQQTLELARRHGHVILVTNAEDGWIELSCKKFMPMLYPFLKTFRQLSARTRYENEHLSCPFVWKQLAFRDEIYRHFENSKQERKNIISIGDSAHERLAVIAITRALPQTGAGHLVMNTTLAELPPLPSFVKVVGECRTKSVKFIERPSLEELIQQHELIIKVLMDVVQSNDDLDLCIRSTCGPSAQQNASSRQAPIRGGGGSGVGSVGR